jgi:hypothetical protein
MGVREGVRKGEWGKGERFGSRRHIANEPNQAGACLHGNNRPLFHGGLKDFCVMLSRN